MGDAVRDGDVHAADPEDTIDAASPRDASSPVPPPVPPGLPAAIVAATRDYTELLEVDRQHYAITRELARGGIGRVFEARDLRLGRQVAIKELLPKNRDAARRFEREARITARLQHPAIIHVYEAGTWPGGEPFYAMPLVAGRSLDTVVAERKSLDERLGLLPNVIAVADALAYAHNANVIHRDLKPANVLVGEFGETVVIDWGLAKDLAASSDPKESLQMRLRATAEETMSGSVVGTPAYMPPEQARGDAVDQRADVYALGALLYKVLCGGPPYDGTSGQDVLDQVKSGPPVPVHEREPGAPPDLVAIVAKAMARDPDRRYVTASELAQDLKRFETGQLVGAHRYTTRELVRRWLHRHRVAVAIATIALVVLAAIGVLSLRRIFAEKQKADDATIEAKRQADQAIVGRINLLEERARTLLDKNAGHALAYLVGAAEADAQRTGNPAQSGARGFMIADAMAPFQAELWHADVGRGNVVTAVSPNGTWIAAASSGAIRLIRFDGQSSAEVKRTFGPFGRTNVVAFDAAGKRLVAAGDDGIVRIWDVERAAPPVELRGHTGPVNDAVFSRDGTLLATAGDDKSVRIWNLATGTRHAVVCHGAPVVSVRFAPAELKVLSASADFSACVIAFKNSQPEPWIVERQIRGHTGRVNAAEWSHDGRFVVTASDDETARVWSEKNGKPVYQGALRHESGSTVKRVLITQDGSIISAGSDLAVRIWELPATVPKDGETPPPIKVPKKLEGHTGQIIAAALSPDGRYLATGGFDGTAKVWDLRTRQQVATFEPGESVTSVVFVRSGSLHLLTGSADGKVRMWNMLSSEVSLDLGYAVRAIAVAGDHSVAVGLGDSLVRVVPADPAHEIVDLHGHLGAVDAVAFLRDGRLVTAGEDPAALVWSPNHPAGAWNPTTAVQAGTIARADAEPPQPIRALAVLPPRADDRGDRIALVRAGAIEVWAVTSDVPATSRREVVLVPAHGGSIDALAVDATTGRIAGVGQDGTLAVWNADRIELPMHAKRDPVYNAVAFARDGALVAAGPGFARVYKVSDAGVDKVEVTLDPSEDIGVVRAVLVTDDGSRVITAGDRGRALIWDRHKGKLLARRDRHDAPITALALDGDRLWIGSDDQMLSAWRVRVDTSTVDQLRQFMTRMQVPWTLEDDVVVRVDDGKQAP